MHFIVSSEVLAKILRPTHNKIWTNGCSCSLSLKNREIICGDKSAEIFENVTAELKIIDGYWFYKLLKVEVCPVKISITRTRLTVETVNDGRVTYKMTFAIILYAPSQLLLFKRWEF